MHLKKWVKITLLCIAWYTASSLNNVVGKHLLTSYPHPMTLTLIQLASITLYSLPLLHFYLQKSFTKIHIPSTTYYTFIVPLSIGKFLASVCSHVSIWKVPVSYAHTVKATMPLFTVVLTRLLYRESHSTKTYLSLIPIITGVAIASVTELNFNVIGLITALLSTLAFSLQNIFSKQVLKNTKLHEFELLYVLARLSLLFYTPLWLFMDFNLGQADQTVLFLLFLDGILAFLQNLLAFSFLNLVTPLSYSVANASKRVFIIGLSIFVFRNEVKLINVTGMVLAVWGVFMYNQSKLQKKKSVLPLNNNYV